MASFSRERTWASSGGILRFRRAMDLMYSKAGVNARQRPVWPADPPLTQPCQCPYHGLTVCKRAERTGGGHGSPRAQRAHRLGLLAYLGIAAPPARAHPRRKGEVIMSRNALLAAACGMLMTVSASSGAGAIHPDCVDNHQPQVCTRVVEDLLAELGAFNAAFNPPDADRLAAFYHEDAILFVGSAGRFFRGHDEIRDEFFAPLVAGITGATVDISAFHFQVISPNLAILYGSPTTVVTFPDGSVVTLPPLPQTLTWVRQGGDRARPFVVLTDHE